MRGDRMLANEHTVLMNKLIGTCYKTKSWSSFLADCGYKLQVIEQPMRTKSGDLIEPDVIVASSKERHALVFECKGGKNISTDQKKRYKNLDTRTLGMWITVKPSLNKHTMSYAVTGEWAPRIGKHTSFPLLVFGKNNISKRGDLGSDCLNGILSTPVSLDGMKIPMTHYPYGPNDVTAVIAPHIYQGIVHLVRINEASADIAGDEMVDRIFRINHTHHTTLSKDTTRQIKARIIKTIKSQFLTDKKVNELLDKIHSGKGTQTTWRSLLTACKKNVERESGQTRL